MVASATTSKAKGLSNATVVRRGGVVAVCHGLRKDVGQAGGRRLLRS